MPSRNQKFGTLAEQAAADYLQTKNYKILGMHTSNRYGEIDILAQAGSALVAVEVKIRRSNRFGTAVESVTKAKLAKIELALQAEAEKRSLQTDDLRIDLVALDPGRTPGKFIVNLYQGIN